MAWMLQPRNYVQALAPNWYNANYRRTGVYKGMGGLGRRGLGQFVGPLYLCPDGVTQVQDSSLCPCGVPASAQSDATAAAPTPLTASQYLNLYGTTNLGPGYAATPDLSALLGGNYLPWILGGALGLVLLLDLTGRRR